MESAYSHERFRIVPDIAFGEVKGGRVAGVRAKRVQRRAIRMLKIAILGFGGEGKSLLKFFRRTPRFKNAEIWILDRNPKIIQYRDIGCPKNSFNIRTSGVQNIKFQTGKNYLKNLAPYDNGDSNFPSLPSSKLMTSFLEKPALEQSIQKKLSKANRRCSTGLEQFDIIFRSPGVPYNLPEIQAYRKRASAYGSGNPPARVRSSEVGRGTNAPTRILTSGTQLFFDLAHGKIERSNPVRNIISNGANRLERLKRKLKKNYFKNIKIIGITGTKGKGTTSTLLYKILKAAGKRVYLAGNIGKPALDILLNISVNPVRNFISNGVNQRTYQRQSASIVFIVLELSSFQLQGLNPPAGGPDIAVVLDIFPDHLDAHKNFREYLNAKTNIAKWQKKTDKIFYFADNKYSKWIAKQSNGEKVAVQYKEVGAPNIKPSILGRSDLQKLKENIRIPGAHNLKNVLMAATVATNLGIPDKIILKTVKNFRGLEHRLEFVRRIRFSNIPRMKSNKTRIMKHSRIIRDNSMKIREINFYNDSASTNPQTAAAAIQAFPGQPKILIAGGKDKNLNYSPLAKALKNSNTKLIVFFGENKNKIKKAINKSNIPIKIVNTLKEAINKAYLFSKKHSWHSHTFADWHYIIIFSPASASFDMFKDYKDRGKKFKEIVLKLK